MRAFLHHRASLVRVAALIGISAVSALVAYAAPSIDTPLDCKLRIAKPMLDMEFRFFTGFEVEIPLKQMVGPKRPALEVIYVTPIEPEGAQPAVIRNEGATQEIPPKIGSQVVINGFFVVGEGRYHVRWEYVDSHSGTCSVEWEIEAKRRRAERDIRVSMAPGEIGNSYREMFRPERVIVGDDPRPPLRIKALLNFDARRINFRGEVQPRIRLSDFIGRMAALRALSRHPRIGSVALISFSIDEQKVLHRQGLSDAFGFPALRSGLDNLSPALVSIEQLQKDSRRDFFADVLKAEIPGREQVDAYVFVGPDGGLTQQLSKEALEQIGRPPAPVFYLNSLRQQVLPWKGLIGNTVSSFKGTTLKYHRPLDLARAVEKLVEEIDQRR